MIKKIVKYILAVIGAAVAVALIYVAYVFITYSRIDDNQPLEVNRRSEIEQIKVGEDYSILSQNMGFGAYTDDFTFFMDGGTQSRAKSKDSVEECTEQSVALWQFLKVDFLFFQEVDTDSTRSFHVNQAKMIEDIFEGYDSVFAQNYHSAYLMYPITEPHGASNSGIQTLAKAQITSGLRRKLEISTGFSKVIDLDRCYSISRVPVDNGKELVLINVHLSAYGAGDDIKTKQINMVMEEMKKEYEAGNYVICGGDFNSDFTGDSVPYFNGPDVEVQDWTMPFPDELIPEGIHKCVDYENGEMIPSVRNCDIPYGEDSYIAIVDGFLVSDNIEVTASTIFQLDFKYSDHNPVALGFRLK